MFHKPKESDNHLKALYMRGHINRKLISRMLVDGGVIVNLMSYSLFKKLGGKDEELIKMNMIVSGVGRVIPMALRGLLAIALFVSEVQGNFSSISYSSQRCKVISVQSWGVIGFTQINVFHLP